MILRMLDRALRGSKNVFIEIEVPHAFVCELIFIFRGNERKHFSRPSPEFQIPLFILSSAWCGKNQD